MSYIMVLDSKGNEVEERKELRDNDKEYNYVLEQAVKITREAWNREHPKDQQTYQVVK